MTDSKATQAGETSFGQILAAVDLGPLSPAILQWSGFLGSGFGSRIEVYHAYWFDYPPYITDSSAEALIKNSEAQRRAIVKELRSLAEQNLDSHLEWSVRVAEGYASTALLNRLEEETFDLLVVGSHGRSGISRLLLGSVAERLIRSAAVPILVARQSESKPIVKNILVPANFTPHSERGVEFAADLASKFGARLHIIHAVEEAGSPEEAFKYLCEWVPSASRRRCEIREVVREGNAAEQVVLAAREESVDLVVLGAERRPFLEFTTLGTTAERVVRHSPCSTLVLPVTPKDAEQ